MGAYTQFSRTRDHTVYYEFRCDHCGKESGRISYTFNGTSQKRKSGWDRNISNNEAIKLEERAEKELCNRIQEAHNNVDNHKYYDPTCFDSRCPHCQKYQSWDGTSIAPIFQLTIGVPMFAMIPALLAVAFTDNYTIGGVILGIAAVIGFILGIKHVGTVTIDRSKARKAIHGISAPTIDWNGF